MAHSSFSQPTNSAFKQAVPQAPEAQSLSSPSTDSGWSVWKETASFSYRGKRCLFLESNILSLSQHLE